MDDPQIPILKTGKINGSLFRGSNSLLFMNFLKLLLAIFPLNSTPKYSLEGREWALGGHATGTRRALGGHSVDTRRTFGGYTRWALGEHSVGLVVYRSHIDPYTPKIHLS